MKYFYFNCDCSSSEHVFRLVKDNSTGDVWLEMQLSKLPLLKRIKFGILYILGFESQCGHWEEVLINKETAKGIVEILSGL